MKSGKFLSKALAMTLALVLLIPLLCGTLKSEAAAEAADSVYAKYTTVFVHGLMGWGYEDVVDYIVPYWGMTAGNILDYLNSKDCNVTQVSVGPVSSAWDRSCEMFAQMKGTVVDYGQAHCNRFTKQYSERGYDLVHGRYGRDYTGKAIVDKWGPVFNSAGKVTGWYDNKVNLIGHSFGPPTILEFVNLLAEGDADEIAWGKQQAALHGGDWHDYVSPLFWGDYDGEKLINSVTSLAGVLNGTTFISANDDETAFLEDIILLMANALGISDIGAVYDFQLEQFGITKTPFKGNNVDLSELRQKGFLDGDDQAWYDLSVSGCNELKQGWKTYDNIYYFSYAGNKTHASTIGTQIPDTDMWIPFMPFSTKIGSYLNRYDFVENIDGSRYGSIDDSWLPNDGMVNTISARYPLGSPNIKYDANGIRPGVWQWRECNVDHLYFSGGILNSKPIEIRRFYTDLMGDIEATYAPSIGAFSDVPSSAYYYSAVNWAAKKGIANGYSSTVFAPNNACTRAQVVTFLWRANGSPEPKGNCPFADVSKSAYYSKAVTWAAEKGITLGVDNTHFNPDVSVSRAEFVTFLWRNDGQPKPSAKCPFGDVSSSAFYYNAVVWAAKSGITLGVDSTHFAPDNACTRAQVVTFIYRDMA